MKFVWQQIPSPLVTELLTYNKFDGVVLDLEHGVFSNETLYSCIQVCTLSKKTCFVRFADINRSNITHVLDAGADGVIFANFEDVNQAEVIFDYTLYPERGCGLVRENKWGKQPLAQTKPVIIAQIEHINAVTKLNDIAKLPFDYFMVGPYDLTKSLGCAGEFTNPDYLRTLNKIEELIPREKLGFHIVKEFDIKANINRLNDIGFLALGMDTTLLLESIDKLEALLPST